MRRKPLLSIEPLARVETPAEVYAIAFEQAESAARNYRVLTTTARDDEFYEPVRSVFKILEYGALHRAQALTLVSVARLNKQPDETKLGWSPADLVFENELSEIANSSLVTPYLVWALAVRHCERAFIFWTYVAAHSEDDAVRGAAEDMARDALHDTNELRRERRLAWRSERHHPTDDKSPDGTSDLPLAALLESLLFKDILVWAQGLPVLKREQLLAVTGSDPAEKTSVEEQTDAATPSITTEARHRAICRAEQLSSIYLDEADHAGDQDHLELAQKLAAYAITRLADLRTIAAACAG